MLIGRYLGLHIGSELPFRKENVVCASFEAVFGGQYVAVQSQTKPALSRGQEI